MFEQGKRYQTTAQAWVLPGSWGELTQTNPAHALILMDGTREPVPVAYDELIENPDAVDTSAQRQRIDEELSRAILIYKTVEGEFDLTFPDQSHVYYKLGKPEHGSASYAAWRQVETAWYDRTTFELIGTHPLYGILKARIEGK